MLEQFEAVVWEIHIVEAGATIEEVAVVIGVDQQHEPTQVF